MGMCAGFGLVEVIRNLNKDELVGLEIGCSLKYTAIHFMHNFPNLKLYGIDPYNVIPAVNKSVIEFANEIKIPQIFSTDVDVWYWVKP